MRRKLQCLTEGPSSELSHEVHTAEEELHMELHTAVSNSDLRVGGMSCNYINMQAHNFYMSDLPCTTSL